MRHRISALLTLACLTAACQPAPTQRREDAVTARQPSNVSAPAPSASTPTPSVTAAPAPTAANEGVAVAEQASQVKLAVDGEGLRLVDARSGSTRPLPFGLARQAVLAPLETLRGPAGQGSSPECGSRYANWADGLSLTFRRGRFVGWALDGRSEGAITTITGLGTGSTKASLDAYDYKVMRTTLGSEFSAGDLHGLLSSGAADAKVTSLWAGEVCLAR